MISTFDPFADRRARDIRNSLATALIKVLTVGGSDPLIKTSDGWLALNLAEPYQAFIHHQMQRYRAVIQEIQRGSLSDIRLQALVLWNARLFFELHELLETIWHGAGEPEHTAYKGLIQAAGVYVHYGYGHAAAARKLALKARAYLDSGAPALEFIANLDELRQALKVLAWPPPVLRAKSLIDQADPI